MGARLAGWAQRRLSTAVNGTGAFNAFLGTTRDPSANDADGVDIPFEVTAVAAGTSVSIRWGFSTTYAAITQANGSANTAAATLNVWYETASGTLWEPSATDSQTTAGGLASLDRTLTFTTTHSGTLRMVARLKVTTTNGGVLVSDTNTDAANFASPAETLGVGVTDVSFNPGLVRSGSNMTSLAFTGPAGSPAEYPENLTSTFALSAGPVVADGAFTLSYRSAPGAANQFLSALIPASTSASPGDTEPATNVFPAANTNLTVDIKPAASALSTALGGTPIPWTHWNTIPASPGTPVGTTDTSNAQATKFTEVEFGGTGQLVDPRLTATHEFQLDDGVFGSPPMSKNEQNAVAADQRLTAQLGFLATNVRSARGALTGTSISQGQNGVTLHTVLRDVGNLTGGDTSNPDPVTTTIGGEAGWTATFLGWADQLPGGGWTKTVTVLAPSTITGAGYLVNSTHTYTLLAPNPAFKVVVSVAPNDESDHAHATQTLTCLIALVSTSAVDRKPVAPDAGSPNFAFVRANNTTGKLEYLRASDLTWQPLTGAAYDTFPAAASANDADLFTFALTAAQTTGWAQPDTDIYLIGTVKANSTPYYGLALIPLVSPSANAHDSYAVDPVGLALSGAISQR